MEDSVTKLNTDNSLTKIHDPNDKQIIWAEGVKLEEASKKYLS